MWSHLPDKVKDCAPLFHHDFAHTAHYRDHLLLD